MMNIASYRNRPDYTTVLRYHDGSTETLTHCGRCMSIIPRDVCIHCAKAGHDADQEAGAV